MKSTKTSNGGCDDNRRSSAESESSGGSAAPSVESRNDRKQSSSRPSTAPVAKNIQHPNSCHRASTAPINSGASSMADADESSSSLTSNVRVVARLRPLSSKEKNEDSFESIRASVDSSSIAILTDSVHHDNTGTITNSNSSRQFNFDAVFAPNATQEEVYQRTCGDMITKSIFRGFNATILAYGQTGSGKTYTMGTDCGSSLGGDNSSSIGKQLFLSNKNSSTLLQTPPTNEGVIGRAVYDLFATRNSLLNGRDRVKVEMSYLEIYNEQAIDLLSDNDDNADLLQVRDSKSEGGGVIVQNLKSFIVNSPVEVAALMTKAGAKRATASTQMNSVSSRSHAICTLTVTIAPLLDNGNAAAAAAAAAGGEISSSSMRAKLTLVDLAGSERIKRTGAEGARMKEGININKGECAFFLCVCVSKCIF